MAKSIIQAKTNRADRECFLCRYEAYMKNIWYEPSEEQRNDMQKHHMMHGTANRDIAERLGLWCYLCPRHHTEGTDAVHAKEGHGYDLFLMQVAQGRYEVLHSHEEWMEIFGKNYLIM